MASLELTGPTGRIEALLDRPDAAPRAAALLCHPHPQGGGTMHSHAVFRAMRALRSEGVAVLRFNFRGVGRSEGTHDHGVGERIDARIAYDALAELCPGIPRLAGGFSFGSWVGLAVGADAGAAGLLGLGLPCTLYDFPEAERSACPKALVQAEFDAFGPSGAKDGSAGHERSITAELQRMGPEARLWIVPGATHLFVEALDLYEATVREAARWLLERPSVF